jgi:hypothetical protein
MDIGDLANMLDGSEDDFYFAADILYEYTNTFENKQQLVDNLVKLGWVLIDRPKFSFLFKGETKTVIIHK